MTNILKWRLTKLPTVEELTLLVEKNIVTKEEAKEVLFNKETDYSSSGSGAGGNTANYSFSSIVS
jgi:hypothetical protein